jgi:imidazolonepropionase-like amidohydrolase
MSLKKVRVIHLLIILVILFCHDLNGQSIQVIREVTIIDVTGKKPAQTLATVQVENGRIKRIVTSGIFTVPKGAEIIEAKGKFLIPGLWDMHTHISYYGIEALSLLVENGVTAIRDMGGDLKEIDQWRKEIKEGSRIGPVIFRAGPFVDGNKPMDAQRTSFTRIVLTAEDGKQAVSDLKELRVDFIKIHSRVPREAFFALADEARRQHIPVMVHVPIDLSVSEVADAGARSIEHTESFLGKCIYEKNDSVRERQTDLAFEGLNGAPGEAIFATLRKNKTWYDPTLVSLYKLKGTEYEKQLGPRLLPIVGKLHKAGVPLLTGSDFAIKAAGIMPGVDLHDELVLFVEAGMTPLEALRAATLNAAECMGVSDSMGSIEPGKFAHMILLEANPLADVKNTRTIAAVFLGGKVYSANRQSGKN